MLASLLHLHTSAAYARVYGDIDILGLTPLVDLVIARIDGALEQLINLLLGHLLAQVR